MKRAVASVLIASGCLSACVERARLNADCEWTNDPTGPADESHLAHDAMVAEELAIRFADVRRGHRSGQFAGTDVYVRTREVCIAALFDAIATNHGVDPRQIRAAIGRRPAGLDVAVLLSFAIVFSFVCAVVARRLALRFPADEPMAAFIATTLMSAIVSAAALMAFALISATVEMVRVGNTHLSYRAGRAASGRHALPLYIAGVIVFWTIALLARRRRRPAG